MKKIYYTWPQVEGACLELARQLNADNWKPDYIVGIGRGGLIPANLLSQYTGIKMSSLDISLRDGGDTVSNCGMAEDAYSGAKRLHHPGDPRQLCPGQFAGRTNRSFGTHHASRLTTRVFI